MTVMMLSSMFDFLQQTLTSVTGVEVKIQNCMCRYRHALSQWTQSSANQLEVGSLLGIVQPAVSQAVLDEVEVVGHVLKREWTRKVRPGLMSVTSHYNSHWSAGSYFQNSTVEQHYVGFEN